MSELNLWESPLNLQVEVISLSDQLADKHYQRLLDMGLSAGRKVVCIRRPPFGGPRVYQLSDTVLSLEKELALNIFVKENR